jgi:hypothetical protein
LRIGQTWSIARGYTPLQLVLPLTKPSDPLMKLERLHEYVLPTVATLAGMGLAVYCGKLTGNSQLGTLAFIVAMAVGTTFLLGLRQYVWILIPILWPLYGQVAVLPLPFSVRDLAVMAVFVGVLALKAFKIVRIKPRFDLLDFIVIVQVVYVFTVYVRNPVGANALGSERIGGRPYLDIGIALLAYWVLSRAVGDKSITPRLPFLVMGSQVVEMVLNAIVFFVPRLTPIFSSIYTGVNPENFEADNVYRGPAQESSGRQPYFTGVGLFSALLCTSLWRPLTLITPIYWFRFLLFSATLVMIGLTGFRSALITIGGYVVISSVLRRGVKELFPMALIGIPALVLLIAMQGTIINLPLSIQRTLSFLPGKWDQVAVSEAVGSTEWRLQIWKIMLSENRFIANKLLGDGFGFSYAQLRIMETHRFSSGDSSLEDYIIVGNVHSGPLSAIRYVGYVGLAIFMVLILVSARRAWVLARRAEGSPYYVLAMFVCIPVIWNPFNYVFIMGGFEGALPTAIFALGMMKMLENSLDVWEKEARKNSSKQLEMPAKRLGPSKTLVPV